MTVTRAGIFIGVNKAGKLPKLKDAAAGAIRMEKWATKQKIGTRVVITDNEKPVAVKEIKSAVRKIIDEGPPDQLIVYFAGHGVNIGYSEYWLLSEAPADPDEAINVNGSADAAHRGRIPHVVFISDACRTAADGIQAQQVRGSVIFPTDQFSGLDREVDRFWACLIGDPANEVRDPSISATEYRALYTDALLDALSGLKPEVVEEIPATGGFVRPRPLKLFLHDEMAARIGSLPLKTKLIQEPDARITSDNKAWISMFSGVEARVLAAGGSGGGGGTRERSQDFISIGKTGRPQGPEQISQSLLRSVASGNDKLFHDEMTELRAAGPARATSLVDAVDRTIADLGDPTSFGIQCGIKIRGARIVEAAPVRGAEHFLSGELVRLDNVPSPGSNVLVVFEGGNGAVVPALPGFIAALTVEDGTLLDVAYEPSRNADRFRDIDRWREYEKRAPELRALRAIAAASTRAGVFRLDTDDDHAIARKMQYAKGIDPTFAVYAAYAYLGLGRGARIREMSSFMLDDLHALLFDVAMLAGELDGKPSVDQGIFPFFPLLAQGWALLDSHNIVLPGPRGALQRTLLPSVWTLFNPDGVGLLRPLLKLGEVI